MLFRSNSDRFLDLVTDPSGALDDLKELAVFITYDMEMFSHYTTMKPRTLDGEPTPPVSSMASITMGPDVNYFYQSEWEYLLVGDFDARENLSSVFEAIYAIRLICNSIAVFTAPDKFITTSVATPVMQACLSIPYVGPVLGPLAYILVHVAFAAAESAVDLLILVDGCSVPFVKLKQDGWVADPEGLVNFLETYAGPQDHSKSDHNDEGGLSYEQYLLIFFLATSDVETLARRTGDLIEWNVINVAENVYGHAHNLVEGFEIDEDHINDDNITPDVMYCVLDLTKRRLKDRPTEVDVEIWTDIKWMFLPTAMFQNWGAYQLPGSSGSLWGHTKVSRGY